MFYSVATVPEAEVDMPATNSSEQSEPTPDTPLEKKLKRKVTKLRTKACRLEKKIHKIMPK